MNQQKFNMKYNLDNEQKPWKETKMYIVQQF